MVGQPRHDPGAPPRRRVLARRPPRQRPRTPSRDRYEEQHKPNHQAANRRQTRCNQATPADTQRQQTPSWQAGSQHRCWSRIGRACVYTAEAKDGSRRHERHPRCPVRLWSVAPGVTTDNQGLSRAQIQQVMGRLGSSTDHRPVPYNDEHQILGRARPRHPLGQGVDHQPRQADDPPTGAGLGRPEVQPALRLGDDLSAKRSSTSSKGRWSTRSRASRRPRSRRRRLVRPGRGGPRGAQRRRRQRDRAGHLCRREGKPILTLVE
jgi:hypothetical protein